MKIECVKEKLLSAISKIEKITSKNPTLPVLRCVYLKAEKNTLTVRATNLEVGIEIKLPVKVEKEGIVAVPASIFYSFISQLGGDKNITLESNNLTLLVKSPTGNTKINCFNHEDFPTIPTVAKEKTFMIGAEELLHGFRSVWYSSSNSSIKPELSSVYVYNDAGSIVFVATDSFRLAEKRIPTKKAKDFGSILIPYKSVIEILRILDESKEEVEVHLTKNQISLTVGNLYFTSRTIDGVFPDYKQIIPKGATTEVILLTEDFVRALKLSNIFSDTFHQVTLKVKPKSFEVYTKNNEVGEAENNISASISGEEVVINFNYKYIIDCFQSVRTDSVTLQFNGINKAMVIRGVSDPSFTYLVMPMNR